MLLEDQRFIHEDLERLEQAVTDRICEEPRNIKDRLIRDHQIDGFLTRVQDQSARLVNIYKDRENQLQKEKLLLSSGDPFEEFYKQYEAIKDHYKKYPNETVENLERAYKRRRPDDGETITTEVDNMFTGEESNGRFLDLVQLHEEYLNLPGIKRHLSYIQYLDNFDAFEPPRMPIKRANKVNDRYLAYVANLASYLEGFIRRTRPLENLPKTFRKIEREFESDWNAGIVPGWTKEDSSTTNKTDTAGPQTEGTGSGVWCSACEKEFSNQNVYDAHLKGKKHIRNAEIKASTNTMNGATSASATVTSATGTALKERLIASHEYRIRTLTGLLSNERSNTRVNVERRAGMTERERQTELDALYAEDDAAVAASANRDPDADSDAGSTSSEKIYNPLKLPLAWDGKPIPYWLYKLHGLGVEFSCEICGNFVYMGRRAFDKHFGEQRHIYGLKCLGITGSSAMGGLALFREITGIEDARRLWEKLKREEGEKRREGEGVVQMEDGEGNVMPERIYLDLQKQGIL